jgi:hypothetical protein
VAVLLGSFRRLAEKASGMGDTSEPAGSAIVVEKVPLSPRRLTLQPDTVMVSMVAPMEVVALAEQGSENPPSLSVRVTGALTELGL